MYLTNFHKNKRGKGRAPANQTLFSYYTMSCGKCLGVVELMGYALGFMLQQEI